METDEDHESNCDRREAGAGGERVNAGRVKVMEKQAWTTGKCVVAHKGRTEDMAKESRRQRETVEKLKETTRAQTRALTESASAQVRAQKGIEKWTKTRQGSRHQDVWKNMFQLPQCRRHTAVREPESQGIKRKVHGSRGRAEGATALNQHIRSKRAKQTEARWWAYENARCKNM